MEATLDDSLPRPTLVRELRASIRAVQTMTPAGAVVSTVDDAATYLYTGRQAVPFASFNATDFLGLTAPVQAAVELREIVATYHPDAVVVTSESLREVADLLVRNHPSLLAVRDSFPGGLIYSPTSR